MFSDAVQKSLVAAFFVASRDIQIKIKDPSATNAFCTYVAVNNAWDAYPPAYFSTLSFMDKQVWGTLLQQLVPKSFATFYRELNKLYVRWHFFRIVLPFIMSNVVKSFCDSLPDWKFIAKFSWRVFRSVLIWSASDLSATVQFKVA